MRRSVESEGLEDGSEVMEEVMGKTIDTSELLYRMGKYAEIDVGEESHDAFMHFMLLLIAQLRRCRMLR